MSDIHFPNILPKESQTDLEQYIEEQKAKEQKILDKFIPQGAD